MNRSRPLLPWLLRAVWAALPFAAGPALAAALEESSVPLRTTASALLWVAWAVVLSATLVLHPVALTVLRALAPAAAIAATWTLFGDTGPSGLVAVAATSTACGIAFLPETGLLFVNGPAYPNERRYPLRIPGPLLLGPVQLSWAMAVGAPIAAALLLAARRWVAGGALAAAAVAGCWVLGRALHSLSRRWVVFVPAGLVLHDPMTLADPVLLPRKMVTSVELAAAGTTALDLTQRSPGLAIEVALAEDARLVLTKPGSGVGPTVTTRRLLFTPTRPGRFLAEARSRRF